MTLRITYCCGRLKRALDDLAGRAEGPRFRPPAVISTPAALPARTVAAFREILADVPAGYMPSMLDRPVHAHPQPRRRERPGRSKRSQRRRPAARASPPEPSPLPSPRRRRARRVASEAGAGGAGWRPAPGRLRRQARRPGGAGRAEVRSNCSRRSPRGVTAAATRSQSHGDGPPALREALRAGAGGRDAPLARRHRQVAVGRGSR